MPKAILTKTYDGFGGKCNFKYAHLKHYDLGGVKVRLKKETASFTRYAGLGLQAVTSIPKGFVLGKFIVKSRDADEPEEGTYNIKTQQGKYLVMEQESLMNRINTIAYPKHRHKCNCTIGNVANGEVSVKTTKPVKAGAMLWTKYGNAEHYYEIQYYILATAAL